MLVAHYPKRDPTQFAIFASIERFRGFGKSEASIVEHPVFGAMSSAERAGLLAAIVRADRAAKALHIVGGQDLFKTKLNAIKNIDFCRPDDAPSNAWDALLEVEVAAQMTLGPLRGELGPTDVLLKDTYGGRLGCECKRPKTRTSVPNAFGKALAQLREARVGGFVLVSGDLFVTQILRIEGPNQAESECKKAIERGFAETIEQCRIQLSRIDITKASDDPLQNIIGVLFCATVSTIWQLDMQYAWRSSFHARPLANPNLPHGIRLLNLFRAGLSTGQAALRRTQVPERWSQ